MEENEDRRAVIVCSHIAQGQLPVLRAVRDEPEIEEDSGWQFLCSGAEDENPDEAEVWLVCEIVKSDPSIIEIIDAPPGTIVTRTSINEPWLIL